MEQTGIQKERTAAFTGHRFIPHKDKAYLKGRIRQATLACHQSGIRSFLCGMAAGFDLLAAEAVLELRKEYPPGLTHYLFPVLFPVSIFAALSDCMNKQI